MSKKRANNISGPDAVRAFMRDGWEHKRTSGSHYILKKPGFMLALSIPVHGNKPVKQGLLESQIKLAGLTLDEFIGLL